MRRRIRYPMTSELGGTQSSTQTAHPSSTENEYKTHIKNLEMELKAYKEYFALSTSEKLPPSLSEYLDVDDGSNKKQCKFTFPPFEKAGPKTTGEDGEFDAATTAAAEEDLAGVGLTVPVVVNWFMRWINKFNVSPFEQAGPKTTGENENLSVAAAEENVAGVELSLPVVMKQLMRWTNDEPRWTKDEHSLIHSMRKELSELKSLSAKNKEQSWTNKEQSLTNMEPGWMKDELAKIEASDSGLKALLAKHDLNIDDCFLKKTNLETNLETKTTNLESKLHDTSTFQTELDAICLSKDKKAPPQVVERIIIDDDGDDDATLSIVPPYWVKPKHGFRRECLNCIHIGKNVDPRIQRCKRHPYPKLLKSCWSHLLEFVGNHIAGI
ncbi:hypothetical protein MPSEU_000631700 [Mayamaea pseudoterrestris]|nr:hypothetical protein MPSEU_000631700 [Mayamaea pseudoterrestris]